MMTMEIANVKFEIITAVKTEIRPFAFWDMTRHHRHFGAAPNISFMGLIP
jgi:hypothetical protein